MRVRFPILPSIPFRPGQRSRADTSPSLPPAARRLPPVQEPADDLPKHWGKEIRPPFAFPALNPAAIDGQRRSHCDTPIRPPKPGTFLPLRLCPPAEIPLRASLPPPESRDSLSYPSQLILHKARSTF